MLIIVFTVWCGLSYFYAGMGQRARDDWQRFKDKAAPDCQNKTQPKQRAHELAKSERHMPAPVEEFALFPWHLDLADVPAGDYWIPSHSNIRNEECDPERCVQGLLERFTSSRRYPSITKLQYAGVSKPHTLVYHKTQVSTAA